MQSACAILHRHLWPVWLHEMLSQSLINNKIFGAAWGGGGVQNTECVLILSTNFFKKISHSKNNSARYGLKNIHRSSSKVTSILVNVQWNLNSRQAFDKIREY